MEQTEKKNRQHKEWFLEIKTSLFEWMNVFFVAIAHIDIFVKKNAFENVVCQMVALLFWPQWVHWIDARLCC